MEDWIKFNFTEHESEEEYLFAQEKMIKIQEEKQVSLEEWDTIWNMFVAKKLEESEEEVEEIEKSQNEIVRAKYQQEGKFNPSGKVYMRQQRSVTAFEPRSTIHIHYNPWRILGVKNIYFRGDEIFTLEVLVRKHKKQNNIETNKTKIQKYLINRKLGIEFKSGK